MTLGAIGLTGAIYRQAFGAAGAGLALPTFPPLAVPGLRQLPLVGEALFGQPAPTYLALALVPLAWWFLQRTRLGLQLRAAGESEPMARAAGVPVRRLRVLATLAGGACAGLGGGALVLAQVGTFAEKMTAGRGFLAVAIVVLGRWHPVGVLLASLLFGAATALQFLGQALGLAVPYQLFLMLPYALTLAALASAVGRGSGPGEAGKG